LIRSIIKHPKRKLVHQIQGAERTSRENSALRARADADQNKGLNVALDALLSWMVLKTENDHRLEFVRRDPSAAIAKPAEKRGGGELNKALNTMFSDRPFHDEEPHANGCSLACQAIWEQVDVDQDDNLSLDEAHELLVHILTRPVFVLLVRARVVEEWQDEAGGFSAREVDVLELAALRATCKAIKIMARTLDAFTEDFSKELDKNGNGTVTNEEFKIMFEYVVDDMVIDRVVFEAKHQLPPLMDKVAAWRPKEDCDHAINEAEHEEKMLLQKKKEKIRAQHQSEADKLREKQERELRELQGETAEERPGAASSASCDLGFLSYWLNPLDIGKHCGGRENRWACSEA